MKPDTKPTRPYFSSGPCSKRPGWTLEALNEALVGRSHRAKAAKARIEEVIEKSASILGLPEGYVCGIVPASDTGAVEMASGPCSAHAASKCAPGNPSVPAGPPTWSSSSSSRDVTRHEADYGKLPDFSKVNFSNDVVFTYNGTTSGVKVANLDWIPDDREGLTICDATSAVFAMDIDYSKLDVVTWSWQKVMGGEGAHGMLVLSPRAIERLESYTPPGHCRRSSASPRAASSSRASSAAPPSTPSPCCALKTRSTACAGQRESAACPLSSNAPKPTSRPSPTGSPRPTGSTSSPKTRPRFPTLRSA